MIDQITHLHTTLLVEVKLVGFEGFRAGQQGLSVEADDLLRYLRAIYKEMPSVVLQPKVENLVVKPQVDFVVSKAPPSLTQRLNAALQQAVSVEKSRPTYQPHTDLLLSAHVVDDVIRTDQIHADNGHASSTDTPVFTVYLLHPKVMADLEAYSYSFEAANEARPQWWSSCPGNHWVSSSSPYMWVDIGAGPLSYGPGRGHQGQVFPHTFPLPRHYKAGLINRAILPDLAAMVWSACQHMLWPPLLHSHVSLKPKVVVQVIHMHDSLGPPTDRLKQESLARLLNQALGGLQSVEVVESWLSFAGCDLCVAAYTSALKVHNARDDETLLLRAKPTRFLDRLALHTALSEYKDGIFGYANLHDDEYLEASRHVLPVFIFDITESNESDLLLLDGQVTASAFSDMVLAVSMRVGQAKSHFTCGFDHMKPPAGDITREVLAALLSAGWAVPDTATYYSAAVGEARDYRWSVGNTPFSPLANALSVPTPVARAAQRSLALLHLNDSVSSVVKLLGALDKISQNGRLDVASTQGLRSDVLQRLNVAIFKAEQAALMLGRAQGAAQALHLARSVVHDVYGLEQLGRKIAAKLKGGIKCEGARSVWEYWWAPTGAVLLWPLAAWARVRLSAPKLEKIY